MNSFKLEKVLSSGAFGVVLSTQHLLDGKKYALKVIPIDMEDAKEIEDKGKTTFSFKNRRLSKVTKSLKKVNSTELLSKLSFDKKSERKEDKDELSLVDGSFIFPEPSKLSYILPEIQLMANLDHPNTIRYYGSWVSKMNDSKQMYCIIQMEYMTTTLSSLLEKRKLTNSEKHLITSQLLCATQYLHENNIIHNDIKPDNVLVKLTSSGKIEKVCLTDFGSSVHHYNNYTGRLYGGTLPYCAPEIKDIIDIEDEEVLSFEININKSISKSIDIYALGIVITQLRYDASTVFQTVKLIEKVKEGSDNIIKKCLSDHKSDRPSITELVETFCK